MRVLVLAFFCALGAAPLLAATQTLTTYYPAPSGNYNKIHTNSLQLAASSLSAVQAQYHCSFEPADNLPPCPAGLMFFDTEAQTIFVSSGTSWTSINATCMPVKPCSATLNCGNDNCGNKCGNLEGACPAGQGCSSNIPGNPGSCM
ncbi:MAG: hypothetical protein KGJ09_07445 [Candidatus Omnitrophica bacterium]|nr:hypothetical protein [Candidatus Omnitrophota bacterium]MDE2009897.1 hypothetical protein [Candidatus Omnitrophota bacterium]